MSDVEDISAAVYGAIASIVLRGHGVNPQQIVAALDRVQYSSPISAERNSMTISGAEHGFSVVLRPHLSRHFFGW
jgi:hypothetical protein